MTYRTRQPAGLIRLAQSRAADRGTDLDTVIQHALETYVGQRPTAQSLGGAARAARMTAEERSAMGRRLALARHRRSP